jgi:hypothetical protein
MKQLPDRGKSFCAKIKEKYKFSSFKDSCPRLAAACEPFEKTPPSEEPKPEKRDDSNPTSESPVPDSSVASAAQTDDLIELTIRCPPHAVTVDINWKNHLDGSYDETGGQGGKLDFEVDRGANVVRVPFKNVRRDGQKIECDYSASGIFALTASYVYKVKREIVSCLPSPANHYMRCKVKP